MTKNFTVPFSKIMKEMSLESVYMPKEPEEILISSVDVNRPGLQLGGFFEFFDNNRIQLIGLSENSFIEQFSKDEQKQRIDNLFSQKPPAVIITRGIEGSERMLSAAKEFSVPLLRTPDPTSTFMSSLVSLLNIELAPRITRHGVLVEVYGEGILLLGESGIGKSETAIDLIKRGHRLIADDAVEIRRVSNKTLVGSAPENIRHFIDAFSEWLLLSSRKKSTSLSIWSNGTATRSMTVWASTMNTPPFSG